MKTFTKVLSMLLVIVMCVGLFGGSAFAIELEGTDALVLSDPDTTPKTGEGESSAQLDLSEITLEGSDELSLEVSGPRLRSGANVIATVGNVGCKTIDELNAAIAENGGTVTLVADVTGEIIVNRAVTIDLNGKTASNITVNANLTIKDSSGGNGKVDKLTKENGTITVTGGQFKSDIKVKNYISSDYTIETSGGYDKVVKKQESVSGTTVAIVNSKECDDIDEINAELAGGNSTVKLVKDLTGELKFLKGGSLDLNGHTLTGDVTTYGSVRISDNSDGKNGKLDGKIKKMSGSVTVTGGSYTEDPSDYVSDPYTVEGSSPYKVVTKESSYVAKIGSTGYKTLKEAYDAAKSGDTITVLEDTSVAANLDASVLGTINKNVTFNLGSNGLTGLTIDGASVGFIGGQVEGITCNNGTVSLNGTEVTGTLKLTDSSLNMGSGKVKDLEAADSKLNVTGGEITDSAKITGTTTRAIKGGKWTLGSGDLSAFEASIADGYEKSGSGPYTVKPKSGGGSGGSGGSSTVGSFTVSPSVYTKGSGSSITVSTSGEAFEGLWYSTSKTGTANVVSNYSPTGATTSATISSSFFEGLTPGTYYLWTRVSGSTTEAGTFEVRDSSSGGGGSSISGGSYSLQYVDGIWKWNGGDDPLRFYSDLMMWAESPAVRVDTKSVPAKTINVHQYWDDGNGYFRLGTNLLESLSAGETYYIQVYDAANPNDSTNILTFRVGPTLKPIDTNKHVINSTKNLKFLCSDRISRVYVGGIELTSDDDFSLSNGRKTVTLSAEFLNKRSAGNTYTISVLTEGGDKASTTFQILSTAQASASPRTGDESNIALWAAFLLLSGTAIVVLLPKLKKHGM